MANFSRQQLLTMQMAQIGLKRRIMSECQVQWKLLVLRETLCTTQEMLLFAEAIGMSNIWVTLMRCQDCQSWTTTSESNRLWTRTMSKALKLSKSTETGQSRIVIRILNGQNTRRRSRIRRRCRPSCAAWMPTRKRKDSQLQIARGPNFVETLANQWQLIEASLPTVGLKCSRKPPKETKFQTFDIWNGTKVFFFYRT